MFPTGGGQLTVQDPCRGHHMHTKSHTIRYLTVGSEVESRCMTSSALLAQWPSRTCARWQVIVRGPTHSHFDHGRITGYPRRHATCSAPQCSNSVCHLQRSRSSRNSLFTSSTSFGRHTSLVLERQRFDSHRREKAQEEETTGTRLGARTSSISRVNSTKRAN
jgi:hypothetical protein